MSPLQTQQSSSASQVLPNRTLVGFLALVFVVGGIFTALMDTSSNLWVPALTRSGILLGAFWLGMPKKGRAAAWEKWSTTTIVSGVVVLLLMFRLVRNPQLIVPLLGVVFVLFWLWPLITKLTQSNK